MNKQIIAVDFHCKYQKVAWLDPPTGEMQEADVRHDSTQAAGATSGAPRRGGLPLEPQ